MKNKTLVNRVSLLLSFLLPFAFSIKAYSQNQSKIDSLNFALKSTMEERKRVDILNQITNLYIEKDLYDSAYQYATLAIKQASNPEYNQGKADAIRNAGVCKIKLKDWEAAYRLIVDAKNIFEKISNESAIGNCYRDIGDIFFEQENYTEAFNNYYSALTISEKEKDSATIMNDFSKLSNLFLAKGAYQKSFDYAQKWMNIALLKNDVDEIAKAAHAVGWNQIQLQNYASALHYFRQSLMLEQSQNNLKGATKSYSFIAIIYYFTSQYDSAIFYNEKAEGLFKISCDSLQVAHTVFNKSGVYNLQGKFEKSINSYYEAITHYSAINDSGGVADCYINIAHSYITLKKYNMALDCLKKHLKISQQIKSFDRVSDSYLNLATTYEKLIKPIEANKYYRLYINLKDSLIEKDEKNKLLELDAQRSFNNVVQKNNIRELEQHQKDAVTQQQLQKQKVIRNSFIAGSLLLMLLIVVLVNRNKLKRTVEMERMRSRLSRDLHDDIGSTLSSINILSRTAQTNLQATGDEKTKSSLEKINERSQRLLDSMSDIIWNINPGNDTIEEVMSRMREYATTILEAKNIDYVFDFPKAIMDCKLNMEVKNNMYLIFKEAVNNLSKYSQCTVAKLSLTFDEKNIYIKIEDNGKGFNNEEVKHRGGINNMQHRAEEIKGEITIQAVIDKGTTIELIMPRYC